MNWKCSWRIPYRRPTLVRSTGESGPSAHLVKAASETALPFSAEIPFFVDDAKGYVFIRRAANEPDQASVFLSSGRERFSALAAPFAFNSICGCAGFVNQVGIENVEFVALDYLGRWIIVVVMSLVIFVPLISHLNSVEVARFTWSIFAFPLRFGLRCDFFLPSEDLLVFLYSPCYFTLVQRISCRREVVPGSGSTLLHGLISHVQRSLTRSGWLDIRNSLLGRHVSQVKNTLSLMSLDEHEKLAFSALCSRRHAYMTIQEILLRDRFQILVFWPYFQLRFRVE